MGLGFVKHNTAGTYENIMLSRSALLYLARQEKLKDVAARFRTFRKITARFIAGEDIDEAIAAIKELNARAVLLRSIT